MADRSEPNGRSSSKFETSDSCFLVFQNPCLPYLFSASRLNRGVSGQAALPSISSHSFRLTHATLLSDLGKSLKTAQAQLGNASEHHSGDLHAWIAGIAASGSRTVGTGCLAAVGPKLEGQQVPGSKFIQ